MDRSRNLGFRLNSNVGMTDSPLALDFDATSIDAARELREASRNPARRRAVWAHDVDAGKPGAWACALLMQLLCQDEDAEVKATASAALANLVASEEGDGFCTLLSEICFGEAFKGVILAAVEQASESHAASRAISIFFQNLLFTVPSFACECVSVGAANHIGRITCAAAGYTAGFSEPHSLDVSSCLQAAAVVAESCADASCAGAFIDALAQEGAVEAIASLSCSTNKDVVEAAIECAAALFRSCSASSLSKVLAGGLQRSLFIASRSKSSSLSALTQAMHGISTIIDRVPITKYGWAPELVHTICAMLLRYTGALQHPSLQGKEIISIAVEALQLLERALKAHKLPLMDAFFAPVSLTDSTVLPSRVVASAIHAASVFICASSASVQAGANVTNVMMIHARVRQLLLSALETIAATGKDACTRLIECDSVEGKHYGAAPFAALAPIEGSATNLSGEPLALWRVCADVILTMVKFDYQASRTAVGAMRNLILSGVASSATFDDALVLAQSMWVQAALSQDHNTSSVAAAALRLLASSDSKEVLKAIADATASPLQLPAYYHGLPPPDAVSLRFIVRDMDLTKVHPVARVEMARTLALLIASDILDGSSVLQDIADDDGITFVAFLLASSHAQLHAEALSALINIYRILPRASLCSAASKEIVKDSTLVHLVDAIASADDGETSRMAKQVADIIK